MSTQFKFILLIYKHGHKLAQDLAKSVSAWLQKRHIETLVKEAPLEGNMLVSKPDFVIVLGGDGTILGVARKLVNLAIPVLGINFGRVGFLTSADPHNWDNVLEKTLSAQVCLRKCLSLRWRLERTKRTIEKGYAINEIVLRAGNLARLTAIDVRINNFNLGTLRSDGLIICTPLGSSGYSVSAGGSLLSPELNAIGITPICPFLTNTAPLVLPGDIHLDLKVASPDCFLTIDGQEGYKLEQDDIIHVNGCADAISFIGDADIFYERLRTRGFILDSHCN